MADVHVRPSRPDDASELGRIQAATWAIGYGNLLPAEALAAVTPTAAAEAWAAAIRTPPTARHVVLTAYERTAAAETTVGFAAIAPAEDEDLTPAVVELVTVLVEPRWGRRGHGSRLLAAAVAFAQSNHAVLMVSWVLDGDVATEKFLTSAGWQRDGFTRGLETGDVPAQQRRFVTDISPAPVEP